jgi:tetratricopeptide (TPR) repeat protein
VCRHPAPRSRRGAAERRRIEISNGRLDTRAVPADSSPSPAADEAAQRLEQAFAAHRAGQVAEAERLYRGVLALEPAQPAALSNLGAALLQLGRPEAALQALDAALAVRPAHVATLGNRAGALRALGRLDEALDAARQATAVDPGYVEGLNTEGLLLAELGRPEAAVAPLEAALALSPDHPAAWNNHGLALSRLSRPEAALASFERALDLAPGFPDALSNHAAALRAVGRAPESLEACDRLLAAWPGHAEAHWSLALQLLAEGRWAEGWPLFEWRWRRPDLQPLAARFATPAWLGEAPVAGRTVLLHYEQGLGDSLQMLRYADLLAERGAKVVLALQPPLVRLGRGMAAAADVVTDGDAEPAYDLHAPLMSLPLAFGTRPDTAPWRGAYLKAPAEAEAAWAGRLGPRKRRRIGLAWSGNPRHLNDRNRSLPLETLQPLLQADADFVSLQKAYRAGERERLAPLGVADWSAELHDFAETAGLLAQLDLVVSVDTSVAHLAGAMGKPVLILLPFAPDFRWGTAGEATPWYPSARLLRQAAPQDWAAPIARAAALIAGA